MKVQQAVANDGEANFAPPTLTVIERRARLSLEQFTTEYRNPRRPVILSGVACGWPVYSHATPAAFRKRYGDHEVQVRGIRYRLGELLDLLETSTDENPAPYPCKFSVVHEFRALLNEISPRFEHSIPDRQSSALVPKSIFRHVNNLEIFFGGRGGQFPYLHYDVLRLHAWITQLHGDKEFTLFEPGQESLLYVNPGTPWKSNIRNHHNPDYAIYPLFRAARRQTVILRAGETLFLPCGWWHTARSLNLTISVAFDQLGPDNWSAFTGDVLDADRRSRRARRGIMNAYLRAIGPVLNWAERHGANRSTSWGPR